MPSKRELRAVQQQQEMKRSRQRKMLLGAGIAVAIVIVVLLVLNSGVFNSTPTPAVAVAATGTCSAVQSFPSLGQEHIDPGSAHVPYNSNPPTSGPHWPVPQNWGIYTTPQVQEQLVHNLEHGAVNIQYKDLTGPEVIQLTNVVRRDSYKLILAPYPGLPADVKVALTAWNGPNGLVAQQVGRLMYCTGVDENAIRSFINAYRDKAPEQVM